MESGVKSLQEIGGAPLRPDKGAELLELEDWLFNFIGAFTKGVSGIEQHLLERDLQIDASLRYIRGVVEFHACLTHAPTALNLGMRGCCGTSLLLRNRSCWASSIGRRVAGNSALLGTV